MTQHMGMMDFSDEEEKDDEEVVGYLQLLPPLNRTLGWTVKEFKDGEILLIERIEDAAGDSQLTGRCTPSSCLQGVEISCYAF